MRKIKLGGHNIELSDSINELTIDRFHTFNKLALIDAGIGSDMNAIDAHVARIGAYVNQGQRENAIQELKNYRQCLAFIIGGLSPKLMSFGALVQKCDGKDFSGSDSDIEELCAMLKDAPQMEFARTYADLKKK